MSNLPVEQILGQAGVGVSPDGSLFKKIGGEHLSGTFSSLVGGIMSGEFDLHSAGDRIQHGPNNMILQGPTLVKHSMYFDALAHIPGVDFRLQPVAVIRGTRVDNIVNFEGGVNVFPPGTHLMEHDRTDLSGPNLDRLKLICRTIMFGDGKPTLISKVLTDARIAIMPEDIFVAAQNALDALNPDGFKATIVTAQGGSISISERQISEPMKHLDVAIDPNPRDYKIEHGHVPAFGLPLLHLVSGLVGEIQNEIPDPFTVWAARDKILVRADKEEDEITCYALKPILDNLTQTDSFLQEQVFAAP